MSVAKVIEVLAEGKTLEEATESAVAEAAKTIQDIRGVYIQDMQAVVHDQKVTGYRVNAKISFVVKH